MHGLALSLFTTALLGVGVVHADNLLVNAGFENPAGTAYTSLPGGSPTITGWTTVLSGVEWFDATGYGGAADGVMIVDLANYVYTGGGIEQTFATEVGKRYDVSFAFGTMAGFGRDGTAHVDVSVAGETLGYDIVNATSTLKWTMETLSFTAVDVSTTLRFTNEQNPYAHFANIDAVSVLAAAPVPEPETYALMLAGLGLVGFAARRRAG